MLFIKIFFGKYFYYDKINKDDIVINDIVVFFLNICCFVGYFFYFYSVV